MIDVDNMKNWKQAAQASGKGRIIYNQILKDLNIYSNQGMAYRNIIEENATKIRTLPLNVSEYVTKQVSKMSIEGKRSSDIAKEIIKQFPSHTKANAKLIARTETSKASTALTRVRSEELGTDWYVWRTSEDQRVRSSHAHMEDVLCQFSKDPSPELLDGLPSEGYYAPGEIYNCRCYAEPLISLDMIQWPHKVLLSGKIAMMTRSKFEAMLSYGHVTKEAPEQTSTSMNEAKPTKSNKESKVDVKLEIFSTTNQWWRKPKK